MNKLRPRPTAPRIPRRLSNSPKPKKFSLSHPSVHRTSPHCPTCSCHPVCPSPAPTVSFHKRVLPANLLSFTSPAGQLRFHSALDSHHAQAYFLLAQQFLTQSDPAYCGITTLVIVLNAMNVDPNVRWRGGWRWFGDESMLLEHCCVQEERVRREGVSLDQFVGMARCQGVESVVKRPMKVGVDEFRRDVMEAVSRPPMDLDEQTGDTVEGSSRYFLVTSFSRQALHQTGDGHFSPIAAYDAITDSCLIMDVARFKYGPFWVSIQELYRAMIPLDSTTNKSRGWVLLYPPQNHSKDRAKVVSVEQREGMRPVNCVPLTGSGVPLCPVEKVKVEFCSISKDPEEVNYENYIQS